MKTFLTFLTEKVTFNLGRDQDYTAHKKQVVILSKDDAQNYKERGQTHGLESHAIKHMMEYNKAEYISTSEKAKTILKTEYSKNPNIFIALFKKGGRNEITNIKEIFDTASPFAYMNTLDVLNDKIKRNEKLNSIEKKLKPILDSLSDKYEKLIEGKLSKAVSLDDCGSSSECYDMIMKNSVISFSTGTATYMIDFKDNSVIIKRNEKVATMYTLNAGSTKKDMLLMFIKKIKDIVPKNNNVTLAIIDIASK